MQGRVQNPKQIVPKPSGSFVLPFASSYNSASLAAVRQWRGFEKLYRRAPIPGVNWSKCLAPAQLQILILKILSLTVLPLP